MPEPWLRAIQLEIHPALAAVLFALQQVREDLSAIAVEDVWRPVPGIPSLGFHLTHIAGSLDRLTTYLSGEELNAAQLAFLAVESKPGASLDQLNAQLETALQQTEEAIRSIDPAKFAEPRYVGRARIPTTVIGLAIHIAEHTQRHCGQAVTTAKLLENSPE